MKQGYAFVFMENGQREAVRAFDGYQLFGRRLKVELARGDGVIKKREDQRRREAQARPCDTLFVVNFDPITTQNRDLERVFGRYGDIKRVSFKTSLKMFCEIDILLQVELKRNFAFVQFTAAEDASKALEALNGYKVQH